MATKNQLNALNDCSGCEVLCLELRLTLGPADSYRALKGACAPTVLTGMALFGKGSVGEEWVMGGAQERSEQKANTSVAPLSSAWHF